MNHSNTIKVINGFYYFYSNTYKMFSFLPLEKVDRNIEFSHSKHNFLKQKDYFSESSTDFVIDYHPENIKTNLANLRQLLIEVTDACNIQCKYCAYGELYANFDKRNAKHQQFSNVKLLIDHLADLWKSSYNTSFDKEIMIGFYGGEPLLNMRLIKETIEYVESMKDVDVHFSYNMTTNGVLLDRYMDFLADKQFKLLISLDGNETNSAYRVDKKGKTSFPKVFANIKQLQYRHAEYFDKKVNFNAVLHDRNSVEDIFSFIKQEFNKIPRVAELNTNGLSEEGKTELKQMFVSRYESFDKASDDFKALKNNQLEDSASIFFHTFIRDFCGNYFSSYTDLFNEENASYIPTGTCQPFERKLFLTVNGKILPCEKMGQKHVLASLNDGVLYLDYEKVGKYYHDLYEKVIKNCKSCFLQKACSQCMFLLEEQNDKLVCPGYLPKNKATEYFAQYLSFAEEHPHLYESLMNNIAID